MKKCSKLLAIRQMQIITTIRHHITLAIMVISKQSTNNKYWRGCGEKGALRLSVGMYTDVATMENTMEVI